MKAPRRHWRNRDRIDECQMWADKAEALASYAKQANDDGLRRMADRIQASAIQRAGELLQEIAPATGAHRAGGHPPAFPHASRDRRRAFRTPAQDRLAGRQRARHEVEVAPSKATTANRASGQATTTARSCWRSLREEHVPHVRLAGGFRRSRRKTRDNVIGATRPAKGRARFLVPQSRPLCDERIAGFGEAALSA